MDNLNLSTQEEWEILKEKLDKIQREVHELYLMRNGAIGPFYSYAQEEWKRAYPMARQSC